MISPHSGSMVWTRSVSAERLAGAVRRAASSCMSSPLGKAGCAAKKTALGLLYSGRKKGSAAETCSDPLTSSILRHQGASSSASGQGTRPASAVSARTANRTCCAEAWVSTWATAPKAARARPASGSLAARRTLCSSLIIPPISSCQICMSAGKGKRPCRSAASRRKMLASRSGQIQRGLAGCAPALASRTAWANAARASISRSSSPSIASIAARVLARSGEASESIARL